ARSALGDLARRAENHSRVLVGVAQDGEGDGVLRDTFSARPNLMDKLVNVPRSAHDHFQQHGDNEYDHDRDNQSDDPELVRLRVHHERSKTPAIALTRRSSDCAARAISFTIPLAPGTAQMGFVAVSISPATRSASAASRRIFRATNRIPIKRTATINTTMPPMMKP